MTEANGTGRNLARDERAALCDLLTALGPEQPTLCSGWQTRDLAAHLVIRERRPDAAAGLLIKPLAGHTRRVQDRAATQPFERLVDQIRRPPRFSMGGLPPLDRLVNTLEYFIHLEDIRRAQPDWAPRPLGTALGTALWTRVRGTARFVLRRFPATVVLDAPGYGEARLGSGGPKARRMDSGGPKVRVTGDPGELTLFLGGRQRAARVDLTGPDELVQQLRDKRLAM